MIITIVMLSFYVYGRKSVAVIRGLCHSFFMEVVSSLCFGQPTPPEDDLVRELLKIVVTQDNQTRDFSYSEKVDVDRVPVIRSFLLQLLMEHRLV